MDSLKTALLEEPMHIYLGLAFALIVLAAIWHQRRSRKWAASLLIPPVLAAVVFGLSTLIVTDREQIIAAVGEIARDIEAGSIAAAEKYLDDDFAGFWQSKEVALAAGKVAIRTYHFKKVHLQKTDVEVRGKTATTHVVTWITLDGPDVAGKHSLIWDIRWIKRPQGWRIIDVERPQEGIEL